jgi:hypothetical protein
LTSADNPLGITFRTIKVTINYLLEVFVTFMPLFATIQALGRTNVAGIIPAFDPDGFPVDQTVGHFFPGNI